MLLRRTIPVFPFLMRLLVALGLAIAPIPMGVATAMAMPATIATHSDAGNNCGCAKDNSGCAKSETCFTKCATAPALEPKRAPLRLLVFAAAAIEELDPSQLDSLLAPPPLPPPRG